MANQIRLKRASGSDPSASDLVVGEVALRTDTAKLFTKNDAGSVAEIGSGLSDGDKGDITVSSSGSVFTIDNDAVTYAKIQNVSATNRILGRDSSGAGVIEEITPANLRTMINVEDGATADQTASEIVSLLSDQNIATTGTLGSGDFTLTGTAPKITFTDSNDNPDYLVQVNGGTFLIHDATNGADKFKINSDGHIDITPNTDFAAGIDVTGNISVSGTVDGRDVAADGTKLDGIEASATADQTAAEIKTLLNSNQLEAAQIANDAVTNGKIAADAVTTAKIADDAITAALIADGAIGAAAIGNDAVGSAELADDAVATSRIQNSAVSTAKIANNAVTADKLPNSVVTLAKIQDVSQNRIAGRVSSGSGVLQELTAANVRSIINVEDGATADQTKSDIDGLGIAASTAATLASARTIAGVSFNGSANISLNNNAITNGAGYITSADGGNAATLDGIDSSSFARSDANDTLSGIITLSSTSADCLNFSGNGVDSRGIAFNGRTALSADQSDGYLRINNDNEFSNGVYVNSVFRADGGFKVGGNTVINSSGFVEASRVPTLNQNTTGSAGTLDGIDSSQFLRSDTADTASGELTITGGLNLGADAKCAAALSSLSDGSTITVPFNSGVHHTVTLGGNRTFGDPGSTSGSIGQSGSIFIVQDGTGSRTASFHSDYKFAGGTAPTLSTAANAVDRLDYVIRASDNVHCVVTLDVK